MDDTSGAKPEKDRINPFSEGHEEQKIEVIRPPRTFDPMKSILPTPKVEEAPKEPTVIRSRIPSW